MATWKARVGALLVGMLVLIGGPGLLRPGPAAATGPADELVVLVDPSGNLGLLTSVLAAGSWNVVASESSTGLYRIQRSGSLAWSASALISSLESTSVVRGVEALVDARHVAEYVVQQTTPVYLDDDLTAASIRSADAYLLMNLPANAPSAPSVLPRLAVLDGGFVLTHEAFPAARLADQWDALDGDPNAADTGNGIDDDGDGVVDGGVGHGLGMVGAALVVCPHADIYCARVLDDEGCGDSWSVANGLAWAMSQGVDVINLSFAMDGYSEVVDLMLQDAANQGIVVVAAAGNQGASNLSFPANLPQVLAVSGTEEDGDADDVANFHANTWMSAPSCNVPGPHPSAPDAYGWWSGTSVSSALAAGTLALAIGENPGDPWSVVDDLEGAALGFGAMPQARVGKQGAGIFDVGTITAP